LKERGHSLIEAMFRIFLKEKGNPQKLSDMVAGVVDVLQNSHLPLPFCAATLVFR
jgi:hypothetical protein